MIRSLWTSAAAITSQQMAVDAISNNVANANTIAYKRNVTQFQDLFYQKANEFGQFVADDADTGISIGTGVRFGSSQKLFDQGKLEQTGNIFDMAINGEGFFKVILADGKAAYTRDGAFVIDPSGQLMTPHGYKLEPAVTIPQGVKDIEIGRNGAVTATNGETGKIEQIGSVKLFKVQNPEGMEAVGQNAFVPTIASGTITEAEPDSDGAGSIDQGFVESSNIDLADEMTQLVIAQRAYQINARALRTSDDMLAIATSIRG